MCADCRKDSREVTARQPASGAARGNSQQRVGILRNPNRAPLPPPRRATLMGKWPRLQSSRRAQPAAVLSAAGALADDGFTAPAAPRKDPHASIPAPSQPHRRADGEGSAGADAGHGANHAAAVPGRHPPVDRCAPAAPRIDVARLMEEVADRGESKSKRSRFGASICAANHPRRAAGSDNMSNAAEDPADGSHAPAPLTPAPGDDDVLAAPRPSDNPPHPGPGPRRHASAWVLAGLAVLAMGVWLGS